MPAQPELFFNGEPVSREEHTNHLGVYLDSQLNFSKHIRESILKATKGISLLKYLSKYVSRRVLDLSYKLYVRPHLDDGDVICHNQRDDLMKLIEEVQYKAALIVCGCWQGTSRERLYEELGWESLSERRWSRRMTIFYKIINGMAPSYLSDHRPQHPTPHVSLRSSFSHIVSATGIFWTAILNLCLLFVNSKTKYASFFAQKGILFIKYVISMELNF